MKWHALGLRVENLDERIIKSGWIDQMGKIYMLMLIKIVRQSCLGEIETK